MKTNRNMLRFQKRVEMKLQYIMYVAVASWAFSFYTIRDTVIDPTDILF